MSWWDRLAVTREEDCPGSGKRPTATPRPDVGSCPVCAVDVALTGKGSLMAHVRRLPRPEVRPSA